jgi:hypothetical protein
MKNSSSMRRQPSTVAIPRAGARELVSPVIFFLGTVGLIAAVFAIYCPSLDYQFILDDHHYVGDPRLQNSGHVWEYFTTYVWSQIAGGPSSFYRPLFIFWLRLNYILFEMSPAGCISLVL